MNFAILNLRYLSVDQPHPRDRVICLEMYLEYGMRLVAPSLELLLGVACIPYLLTAYAAVRIENLELSYAITQNETEKSIG